MGTEMANKTLADYTEQEFIEFIEKLKSRLCY
jgi:hypothetical protein